MIKLALTVFLFFLQDAAEIDRLIRALGSDVAAERDKAQNRLLEIGPPALPALRKAAGEGDAEIRRRAAAIVEDVERFGREKAQDEAEMARRLAKCADLIKSISKDDGPGCVRTPGAHWFVSTRPLNGGLALLVHPTDFLDIGDAHAEMQFDLEVTDLDGKALAIERCGVCSPTRVYVPGQTGKLRVHVKGMHTWYSPYKLEFDAPKKGDQRKVGPLTIQVSWPELKVVSSRGWPKESLSWIGRSFSYDTKPGVPFPPIGGIGIGGGKGGGYSFSSNRWCGCKDGPKPWVEKSKPELIREWAVTGGEKYHRLDQVATIYYTVHKPVESPVDFTVEIEPKAK
jgi:hypothetical protein